MALAPWLFSCSPATFTTAGGDGGAPKGDARASSDADPCVAGIPSGGVPCDPGQVQCGQMTCGPTPGSACCVTDNGAQCDQPMCGGRTVACDETADCPSGMLCCMLVTPDQGGPSTDCRTDCAGAPVVCKTNAECPNGCVAQQCASHGSTVRVETCGGLTSNLCPSN